MQFEAARRVILVAQHTNKARNGRAAQPFVPASSLGRISRWPTPDRLAQVEREVERKLSQGCFKNQKVSDAGLACRSSPTTSSRGSRSGALVVATSPVLSFKKPRRE